jgi:hypothetical protein
MKTHSVTVLDAYANYEERGYRNKRTYDPNAACTFDYSVGFYDGEEERYVTLPINGEYERIYIKDRDISSVLEYERHLEKTQKDKKKLAGCKELLSHAKYILSLDKESILKEFENYRETLKSAYEESLKTDRYMLNTEDDKNESYGMILYKDKSAFKGDFKNGLIEGRGITIYPNGNIFNAYYKNGVWENSRKTTLIYDKAAIRCFLGYFDENLKGSGEMRMEFGYHGVNESYDYEVKRNSFDGNFTDGVANGDGRFYLEHERDGIIHKYSYINGGVKDGYFDGQALLMYDFESTNKYGHKNYEIEFQKGKIVKTGGFDKALIKDLQKYLDIIQPFVCDVNQTHLRSTD